jgi:integrase
LRAHTLHVPGNARLLAGLRNGEACALDWRDVRLASGSLLVRAAKTEAGRREVDLPLALREELTGLKQAAERSGPGQPVFVNWDGKRQTVSNLERRLKTAIRRANKRLAELGIDPIPEATTPHSLRRLYASLRSASSGRPGLHRGAGRLDGSGVRAASLRAGGEAP